MFDELQPEPEDVFAKTDASAPKIVSPTMNIPVAPAPVAPVLQKATTTPSEPMRVQGTPPVTGVDSEPKKAFPWKVVILVVAIVAVIGLAFFLSMRILNSRTPVTPKAPEEATVPAETSTPAPVTPTVTETAPVVTTTPESAPAIDDTLDSDKDGLTDVREATLGTDPQNADTDNDGLFDKEEVDVYLTNPLNPDTDGDTFKDGDEVKKGYNPNGPGKLLEIPQK